MKTWAITGAVGFAAVLAVLLPQMAGEKAPEVPRMPVLLVHGSGLNSSSWDALIGHLRASGWPPEYLLAVDLEPNDGANVPAALGQLQPAALRLLAAASERARQEGWDPPRKLSILAHSMGAVSGRWLAAKLMPEKVAVFVALAGANHGTEALCGLAGAGNQELCPASSRSATSVLIALNGTPAEPRDETPFGPAPDPPGIPSEAPTASECIAWYTVVIDPDEWIVPAVSAQLAGAGGGQVRQLPVGVELAGSGQYRLTSGVRHDDIPAEPAVMELVESLLTAPTGCRVS